MEFPKKSVLLSRIKSLPYGYRCFIPQGGPLGAVDVHVPTTRPTFPKICSARKQCPSSRPTDFRMAWRSIRVASFGRKEASSHRILSPPCTFPPCNPNQIRGFTSLGVCIRSRGGFRTAHTLKSKTVANSAPCVFRLKPWSGDLAIGAHSLCR